MTEPMKPSEADRLLFADLFDLPQATAQRLFAGDYDNKPGIMTKLAAIARHREAHTRPASDTAGDALPVGEIVMFGDSLKEVSWSKGKLPPVGTKLYAQATSNPRLLESLRQAAAEKYGDLPGWARDLFTEAASALRSQLPSNGDALRLVAGYADYKAISDDRWEQGKAAGYRELGEIVAAALSQPSPDEETCRCDACGRANPVWFAPSPLWNLVVGGPDATDDPGGILCPACFIEKAEAAGIMPSGGAWLLTNEAPSPDDSLERSFALGQRVEKTKGSSWRGRIVGFYSTDLTPLGYAVESEREPGSVQIYPESALALSTKGAGK